MPAILIRLMRRDVTRRMLILFQVIVMNIVRLLDRVLDRVLVVYGSWTHILSPADRANYVLPATERTLLEEMQCSLANCELDDDDDDDDDDESQVHQRCIWTMAAHIYKRLYENSRRFFLGKTTAVPSLRDIYHRHPQAFPKYVLALTREPKRANQRTVPQKKQINRSQSHRHHHRQSRHLRPPGANLFSARFWWCCCWCCCCCFYSCWV